MQDRDGVLTIALGGSAIARVLVLAFFSLFGIALLAVFVASVVAPSPGEGPAWGCLAAGLPWTLLCVLGAVTRQYVEIDGGKREVRQVLVRFGMRSVHALPAERIARVGVVPMHRKSGSVSGYEVKIETRDPIPFLGLAYALPLHGYPDAARADADARVIAERLGVSCTTVTVGKEPGT